MADIDNVNLLFLRRVRGIAPLSRFAVGLSGSLAAAVPDELEVRTSHIARFEGNGRSKIQATFSVETLRKVEIAADLTHYLGTTEDDLYLFRDGKKSRFLPDRRVSYTDVALAEDGSRFICAFCDMMQSVSTIALGERTGRLLWHKDIGFEVSRVALTRSGEFLAVAGQGGELHLMDGSRKTIYTHRQDAPIAAVATLGPDRTVFACSGDDENTGGVGCVGPGGGLLWFTELLGEPIELALSDAGTIAVLLATDVSSGRLIFLSDDGLPVWDFDFDEARPSGLSVSADGSHAAVTLKDGTLALYELHLSERLSTLSDAVALSEARHTIDSGNLIGAVRLLRGRLIEAPSDLGCAALLTETLTALTARLTIEAQSAEAVGDWCAADASFSQALDESPFDPKLPAERAALRQRWHRSAVAEGRRALAAGNAPAAERAFLEAIEADPLQTEARSALGEARASAATFAIEAGKRHLALGETADALRALTEARRRGATDTETGDILRQARVADALSLGNTLYNDRQYAAALFQFKKVLRLDPRNAEALQKVGYAQNFLSDNQLSERFTRLE